MDGQNLSASFGHKQICHDRTRWDMTLRYLPNGEIGVHRWVFCVSFSTWNRYKKVSLSYDERGGFRDTKQNTLLQKHPSVTQDQSFALGFAGLPQKLTALCSNPWAVGHFILLC